MLVETVFQYRTLIGKCELGFGLNWDEIELLSLIEQRFASDTAPNSGGAEGGAAEGGATQRGFTREPVALSAILRGERINDRVEITEIGPGDCIATVAPFIPRGEPIEVVMNDGDHSYHFRAVATWFCDDGDDYRVGMAFVGMPICLHIAQLSEHELDVVDKIGAAA